MTNTVNQQPTAVSLQTTDYFLTWQGSQSPATRKTPVSALATYYAPLTGATFTGNVTVSSGGITITGNSTITGTLGGLTGLTVASGGINVTGTSVITGALSGITGLTVASGGATITSGGATVTAGDVTLAGGSVVIQGNAYNSGSAPLVSETSNAGNLGAAVFHNATASAGVNGIYVRTDRTDGNLAKFLFGASTTVGTIAQNGGTGVTYNTTSDERLKDHVGYILNSGAIIDKLRPRWFRWKAWPDRDPEPGFFAQQVYRVFPWAVTKGRGKPGSKNFQPWQMDDGIFMPVVIAELQSLRARVKELECR